MRSFFDMFRPTAPEPDRRLAQAMENSERELRTLREKVDAARIRLEREIARQHEIDKLTSNIIPVRNR